MDNELKPSQQVKQQVKTSMQSITVSTHSGPLPPPESMRGYEEVVKGSAERILVMAEKEQENRFASISKDKELYALSLKLEQDELDQEKEIIRINARNSLVGLIFGFVAVIVLTISTVILILHGHDIAGSIFGGTTVVAIVSTLIYGSRVKQQEIIYKKETK